jgi:hypothetical protein
MSDIAGPPFRYITCTPEFWPRHDGNRTDAGVDQQCLRQCYAIIAEAAKIKVLGSEHGASSCGDVPGQPLALARDVIE